MRLDKAFLVSAICVSVSVGVSAKEVSWSVTSSENSPFSRLAAMDEGAEILSLACVKPDIDDAVLSAQRNLLVGMRANDSVAILVHQNPADKISPRLNLESIKNGEVVARTQMAYVDDFESYFTSFGAIDFMSYFMESTTLKFQGSNGTLKPVEVDFAGVFRDSFAPMAEEHCEPSTASTIAGVISPPAQGSITEPLSWQEASGWPSKKGTYFLLRRWSENGLVTQLSDGSDQTVATLTTLDRKKSASSSDDFLVDAGNRYFFRAGHNENARAVAAMTHAGDLSLLTTEDSFSGSLRYAAPLGDGWILIAGGVFHLSAGDELSNLGENTARGSFPAQPISVGDRVIYIDRHPEYGVELFATDGTVNGTGMLLDINDRVYRDERTRDSNPQLEHAVRIGNRVVFTATDVSIPSGSAQNNYHIWSSDGTAEGTLKLPTDDFYSSFSNFIEFEGRLYVTARPRSNGADVLYSTDGTPEGTRTLASTDTLVKAAGGDPEKVRSFLGEPTRVGSRLILPLLGTPLGRERGNPLFEILPDGELNQLSETSQNIGDLSRRLRQTGLSAGGLLLYAGTAVKDSTTFKGKQSSNVIRSVDPDSGDTNIIHEFRSGEKVDWSPNLPRRLAAADAVAFVTRLSSGRNIIATDGTAGGTHALSQASRIPAITAFAFSDKNILWIEDDIFYSFDPNQSEVVVLFDSATAKTSRPGNALLGTMRLH